MSQGEKFIETRKKKRKMRKRKYMNWKMNIVWLVLLLNNCSPVEVKLSSVRWKTEMVMSRTGLEESQGRNMGTRADAVGSWMERKEDDYNWMEGVVRLRERMLSHKKRNKRVKCENGNGQNNYLKISHWNIGAKQWHKKIEDIEMFLFEKDPDILIVSEANLMREVTPEQRHVNGYEMVLPNSMQLRGYARIIMLIREGIEYKLLEQYMLPGTASIWIQVGRRGRKPIRIGGLYREHTLLRQNVRVNMTADGQMQADRWNQQLAGWVAAAAGDKSCVMLGDINLDFL